MFITIEGPEGSGKSSVTKKVAERLEKEGYDIVFTREPGGTDISEQIRNIILDKSNTKMDPMTFETSVIDTFATDANGEFTLPSNLVYGDYTFVELSAPYGYWLPSLDNTDIEDVPLNADGTVQKWIGYTDTNGNFVYTPDKWGHTYDAVNNIVVLEYK